MSQKQDSVVFLNVARSYSPQQDLHVCYQRDAELKTSSRDWVGLFRVGWSSSRDYYTFEWTPSVEEGTQATVIFAGRRLPPEDGHFYQLCYVTREVRAHCTCIALFSLVSFPDPFRKNREGVWQHVLHCGVQKEFNQLLNHVLMFTQASGTVIACVTSRCMQYLCVGHRIMEQCRFCA